MEQQALLSHINEWLEGKLSETAFFDFEHRLVTDSRWRKEVFDLLPDTEAGKSGRLQSDAMLNAMVAPLLDEFQENSAGLTDDENILDTFIENAAFQDFKQKAALWKEDLDNLPQFPQETQIESSKKNIWPIVIAFIILICLLTFWALFSQTDDSKQEKVAIPELHFIRASGGLSIIDSAIIKANLPTDIKHYQFRPIGATDWIPVREPFLDSIYEFKVTINRGGWQKDSIFKAKPIIEILYADIDSNYALAVGMTQDPNENAGALNPSNNSVPADPSIFKIGHYEKNKDTVDIVEEIVSKDYAYFLERDSICMSMTEDVILFVSNDRGIQSVNEYEPGKENYLHKKYDVATIYLEKIQSNDHNYYKAQLMLSDIYRQRQDYDNAIRCFEQFAEVSESSDTKWRLLMLYLADYAHQKQKFKTKLKIMLEKGSPENKTRAKTLQKEMKKRGMLE